MEKSEKSLILFPQFVMELTFTQAAKGVNKEITVKLDDTCPRCDGQGREPGTKVQHCHYCNGTGMVRNPFGTCLRVPLCLTVLLAYIHCAYH